MKIGSKLKRCQILVKAGTCMGVVWFVWVTAWMVFLWYQAPCIVSMDVRGSQMGMTEVTQWVEVWNRGKNKPEILGVTGWRWRVSGERERVYAPDTGRWCKTSVVEASGRVTEGMPFAGKLVAGYWNVGGGRKDVCMVSEKLAEGLFGSFDVVGASIRLGTEEWEITGVTAGKEERLIVPGKAVGTIDGIAVWATARWGIKRVLKELRRA